MVRALIAGVALVAAILVLRKLLTREKESPHHMPVRCGACGWSGQVSKYKPRCPKCGEALG